MTDRMKLRVPASDEPVATVPWWVTDLAFSSRGWLAVATWDAVQILAWPALDRMMNLECRAGFRRVAVDPSGTLLAVAGAGSLDVFRFDDLPDASDPEPWRPSNGNAATTVAWDTDGALYAQAPEVLRWARLDQAPESVGAHAGVASAMHTILPRRRATVLVSTHESALVAPWNGGASLDFFDVLAPLDPWRFGVLCVAARPDESMLAFGGKEHHLQTVRAQTLRGMWMPGRVVCCATHPTQDVVAARCLGGDLVFVGADRWIQTAGGYPWRGPGS
jgi:hypothetical protein